MEGASKRGRRPAADRGVEEHRPISRGDAVSAPVAAAAASIVLLREHPGYDSSRSAIHRRSLHGTAAWLSW